MLAPRPKLAYFAPKFDLHLNFHASGFDPPAQNSFMILNETFIPCPAGLNFAPAGIKPPALTRQRKTAGGLFFMNLTPLKLSANLAGIVGKKEASRADCVKQLWAYLKKHNLQDPENKQFFTPDAKMAKIFGKDRMRAFAMSKFLSANLSPTS